MKFINNTAIRKNEFKGYNEGSVFEKEKNDRKIKEEQYQIIGEEILALIIEENKYLEVLLGYEKIKDAMIIKKLELERLYEAKIK